MDKYFDFIFNSQNIDITVDDNGIAWFQGPQIASILGYSHSPNMYKMLSPNEKGVLNVNTLGGVQEVVAISEYGLYRLIASSRRPEAVEFQNWLYYQVLPSIRLYGAYIDAETRQALDADPNLVHDLNQRITTLQDQNRQLKEQNALSEFSHDINAERLDQADNHRDYYHVMALIYQDMLARIGANSLGSTKMCQRAVLDILNEAKNFDPVEYTDGKMLLYHVIDHDDEKPMCASGR